MRVSRRDVLVGSAGALSAVTLPFPTPAIAQSEPIKIGCLAAMTGPSSAPTIGFNRGVNFATDAFNAAGGVKGRKIEIVVRDTQGDPTKAVNATQELISQAKVHAIWGPFNSGEALATTPIMARAKMPDIHPCVVESLIDTTKFPNAFRMAPSNREPLAARGRNPLVQPPSARAAPVTMKRVALHPARNRTTTESIGTQFWQR